MGDDDVKLSKGVRNGGVAGGFEQGNTSSKPAKIGAVNISGKVDNAYDARVVTKSGAARMQTAKIEGEIKKRIDNEIVIDNDVYGNTITGTQKYVGMTKANAQYNYNNETADAIKGGVIGSAGYLIAGRKGALIGAQLDQVITAKVLWDISKPVPNQFVESLPKTEQLPIKTGEISEVDLKVNNSIGNDRRGITVKNTTPQTGEIYANYGTIISNGKVNIKG